MSHLVTALLFLIVIINLCFGIIYELVVYEGSIVLTSVNIATLILVLGIGLGQWNRFQNKFENLRLEYQGILASKNKAQTMFDTLFETVPCAIAAIAPNYEIRAVNSSLTELVKIDKKSLLGQTCFTVFNTGVHCDDCPVKQAFLTKKTHHNSKRELARTDQEVYIDQIALPILDEHNHVRYVLEIITDVTETKLASHQKDKLFLETITALTKLVDSRDEVTGKHSYNTRNIALRIGKLAGLSEQQLEELSISATLHDIGKIGISDQLLKKPGKLTAEEYDQIKKHAEIGYEALKEIRPLKNAAISIHYHHENFDGTGYPSGLQGDSIPLISRIITIADVWEAINADRPYRQHLSKEQAVLTMLIDRGKKFDPKLLDLFFNMICLEDPQISDILQKAESAIEYQKRKEKIGL